jgi:hypothetical protein
VQLGVRAFWQVNKVYSVNFVYVPMEIPELEELEAVHAKRTCYGIREIDHILSGEVSGKVC